MEVDRTLLQATAGPSLEGLRVREKSYVDVRELANTLIIGHWFGCTMCIASDELDGSIAEI